MTISLIVCTLRRPAQVRCLLQALACLPRKPDETLVIDASPDELTERVVREFARTGNVPHLHYHPAPPNHRGLTRQRNYGLERASGDIVAFLDDDTVPEPGYFEELLRCFERHPEAVGVGGNIINEMRWQRVNGRPASPSMFRLGEWEQHDSVRWRLRRLCGLQSCLPPGYMPTFGHGRPPGFPPDGADHRVELVMGGASSWRRELCRGAVFSHYFEGYGLYEDLDFSIRAGRYGSIYVCSKACLAHYNAEPGRPNQFHYGLMVVRNGWFVWRRRWPNPGRADRFKWWAITALAALCRLGNAVLGPKRSQAITEFLGRLYGTLTVWISPPRESLNGN